MPNLQGSTPQGGGPTLRCFGVGRAVLIFPREEKMGTAFDGKDPKPYIECNVVALPDQRSAPYITFGGEVLQDGVTVKTPDTHRVDLGPHGWMAESVKISGGGMLYILRAAMRSNSARVGRLFKDTNYNNAWKLTDPDKDEPELMAQAAWWLGLLTSQTFTNSFPVPINPVPAQPAPNNGQTAVWNTMEQGAAGYAAPPQQPPAQSWPTNPAPVAQPQSAPPAQGWAQQAPQPVYAGPPAPAAWPAQPQQPAPQGWAQQPQGPPADQQPHPGF
jgi:hypothetical protein